MSAVIRLTTLESLQSRASGLYHGRLLVRPITHHLLSQATDPYQPTSRARQRLGKMIAVDLLDYRVSRKLLFAPGDFQILSSVRLYFPLLHCGPCCVSSCVDTNAHRFGCKSRMYPIITSDYDIVAHTSLDWHDSSASSPPHGVSSKGMVDRYVGIQMHRHAGPLR